MVAIDDLLGVGVEHRVEVGSRLIPSSTARATSSSGETRTSLKPGRLAQPSRQPHRTASTSTSAHTVTCGIVKALRTIASAMCLRMPLTGSRRSPSMLAAEARPRRPGRRRRSSDVPCAGRPTSARRLRGQDVVAGDRPVGPGRREVRQVDAEVLGQLAHRWLGPTPARRGRPAGAPAAARPAGGRRRGRRVTAASRTPYPTSTASRRACGGGPDGTRSASGLAPDGLRGAGRPPPAAVSSARRPRPARRQRCRRDVDRAGRLAEHGRRRR